MQCKCPLLTQSGHGPDQHVRPTFIARRRFAPSVSRAKSSNKSSKLSPCNYRLNHTTGSSKTKSRVPEGQIKDDSKSLMSGRRSITRQNFCSREAVSKCRSCSQGKSLQVTFWCRQGWRPQEKRRSRKGSISQH